MNLFENKIIFSCNIKLEDGKKKPIGLPKNYNNLKESIIKTNHKIKCILTGYTNNIIVIDFDKELGMSYYNKYKDILEESYTETSYSGYKHVYYLYDEDFDKSYININNYSIDILSNGKFCFMSDNNNGKNILQIPQIIKDFLLNKNNESLDTDEEDCNTIDSSEDYENNENNENINNINKIKELVQIINKSYSDNYQSWINIGMCIKKLINDDDIAFDIWQDFSKLSEKYNVKECKKIWKTFHLNNNYKINTLTEYAKHNKKEFNKWCKQYNHKSNKPIINKENVLKLNKFNLDDKYNFCTFKDYIFKNIFNDIDNAIEYIENNLYKCCVRVNDYMITKQPVDDFNNIHSIEQFNRNWRTEIYIKYYNNDKLNKICLKDLLEDYPHLLNIFEKINTEFITKDSIINENNFYITEDYKATYINNINDNDIEKIQPLLDMIKKVYCNNDEKLYNLLMSLFSFWVCNPNEKSGKCLILTGKQGCGKSTIIDFFSEFIFGKKICMFLKGFKELLADKNGHLSGKKFVNLNEVRSKKGDYYTNYDDLKTLISDSVIQIRGLFKETKNEKSSMELVITTNNPNCCPIEENDRKYIVLNVSDIYMQKDKEFWQPFRKQIFNQEVANIFYSYLYDMNTTTDKWRSIDFASLNTELKNDLHNLNMNSIELFINDLKGTIKELNLKNDMLMPCIEYENIKNESKSYDCIIDNSNNILFQASKLYDGYISYCYHNGENSVSNKYFGFELKTKINLELKKKSSANYYIFKLE
jgi:hypothetical protein